MDTRIMLDSNLDLDTLPSLPTPYCKQFGLPDYSKYNSEGDTFMYSVKVKLTRKCAQHITVLCNTMVSDFLKNNITSQNV